MDELLKSWGVSPFGVVCIGLIVGLFWWVKNYYFKCLVSNTDRTVLLKQLEAPNGWRDAYHIMLQRWLDRLDYWLKPAHIYKRSDLTSTTFSNATRWFWSAKAFSINLTIAVIYPVVLQVCFWVFSNTNTSAIDGAFPENISEWRRYTIMILSLCFFFLVRQSAKLHGWNSLIWLIVALAVAVAGVVAGGVGVGVAVGLTGVVVFAVAVAVGVGVGVGAAGAIVAGIAGVVFVTVAVGVAGAGAFAVAVGVFVGVAGALLFAIVVRVGRDNDVGAAIATALTIAFFGTVAVGVGVAITIAGTGVVAGVVASAVVVLIPGLYMWTYLSDRQWLFYFVLYLFAGVAIICSFKFSTITNNKSSIYLLIFLITIPLINALYDYLSLGLTRYLLQRSLDTQRNLVWFALIDFLAACLFLLTLSLTIVAAFSGLNQIAASHGAHPLDIGGILLRLRHTPSDMSLWWIYAMIFSTFLPTFAHAAIAAGNMSITRISKKWRNLVIAGLRELEAGSDGHHAKESGALYFALQRSWTVVMTLIGITLLGTIVYIFLPGIGHTILFLCESLAQAMGEDVSPGNIMPFFGFLNW